MIRTLSAAVLASAMMAGGASAQVYLADQDIVGPEGPFANVVIGNDAVLTGTALDSSITGDTSFLLGNSTINGVVLAGTGALTVDGPAAVVVATINSDSTYTGATLVTGVDRTLVLGANGSINGTSGITVTDGNALVIANEVSKTHTPDIDLSFSGTLTLAPITLLGAPATTVTTLDGEINGDWGSTIVKAGNGDAVLNVTDASFFRGDIEVVSGNLDINGTPALLGGRVLFGDDLDVAADTVVNLTNIATRGDADVDGLLTLNNSGIGDDLDVWADGHAILNNSSVGEDLVVHADGRATLFNSEVGDTLVVLDDGFARVTSSDIVESLVVREGGRAAIRNTFIGENLIIRKDAATDNYGVVVARAINEVGGNVFNDSALILRGGIDPVSATYNAGQLFVGGDYTQTDESALFLSVRGGTPSHGQIVVGDEAFIDGALIVGGARAGLSSPDRAYRGDVLTLIDTVNGVNGAFDEVYGLRSNTMLHYDVRYTADAVQLVVHQDKFASLEGLTHNQRQVASALDAAAKRNQIDEVFTYLNYTNKKNVPELLSLLSPEALTSVYNIGFATSQIQNVHLERRLEDVRAGAYGFSANGFAMTNSQGTINYDGAPVANTQEGLTLAGWDGKSIVSKEVVAPVIEQSRWGFFITGHGEWADIETTQNSQGQSFESAGFTLGADYRVSENFVVGINGGYTHTSSDWDNNGRVRVDGGRGGVYGSFFSNGFFVNAAVGGGYNSYRTNRTTIGTNQARGDFDGGEFNALLGLGYDVHVGGLTIGPVASAQYTYIGIGSFEERGSVANLNFRKQHQESFRSTVGLKASYAWDTGSVIIRPEVRAQWKHEYLDSTPSIEARFAGADRLFRVDGPDIGRDSLLLDAGASVEINPAVSVYAYYTGELGRTNYDSHSVNGGFRVSF